MVDLNTIFEEGQPGHNLLQEAITAAIEPLKKTVDTLKANYDNREIYLFNRIALWSTRLHKKLVKCGGRFFESRGLPQHLTDPKTVRIKSPLKVTPGLGSFGRNRGKVQEVPVGQPIPAPLFPQTVAEAYRLTLRDISMLSAAFNNDFRIKEEDGIKERRRKLFAVQTVT
eukprot:Colp12_sorted_trinity150504_noHs@12973